MAHGLRTPRGKQATARLVGVARPEPVGVVRRLRSALLLSTALQASTLLLLAVPARAQPAPNARPNGGIVTAGSASIRTSASTTTITQSSQRTAINWQNFDVGSQQTVDFIQPSSSSVALNRVISANPSQIAGRIDANGQIILINQSGVIFDQGAQVNTAGLIVSAAGMNNVNFMAGKLVFDQAAHPNAAVVNQGSLTVRQAGLAALVAPQVANSGVITAKLGHVVLAGAKTATLDLYGDGLVSLDVNNQVTQAPVGAGGKPVAALVTNTGVIRADGGTVQLTAREADGLVQNLVQAGGKISANSVGSQTGTVVISGLGGSIALSGVVTADGSSPGTTGGQVQVDASRAVTLAAGARVSASGPAGGGTVAIGTTLARAKGGPGTAAALTARTVTVAPGASISADATGNGDGGRVTVLSNLSTSMAGNIYALGGPQGGNGGFVEVSGEVLGLTSAIDVSAPRGSLGTILLDPTNLTIISPGPGGQDGNLPTILFTAPDTEVDTVSNTAINASTGNVLLQATQSITVDAPISLTSRAGQALTLEAGGTVAVLASITASGNIILATGGAGPGAVPPAVANPGIGVALNATVTSTGGSVSLLAGPGGTVQLGAPSRFNPGTTGSLVAASGQTVTLQADTLTMFGASSITAPNGAIEIAPATNNTAVTLAGPGGLSISTAALADMSTGTLRIGAATINGTQTTTAASITVAATVDLSGIARTLELDANGAIDATAAPLLNVGTLTGNSVRGATLNQANTVNTLGPWNDSGTNNGTGLTFVNAQAVQTSGLVTSTGPVTLTTTAGDVTVNGTVSSGNSVAITATGALAIPGAVNSPELSLTGDSIDITGVVTDGGAGFTFLSATGGGITETGGTLIAGTLQGDSVGSVSLGTNSTNTIVHLDGFDVTSPTGSFALTDNGGLSILGAVFAPNGAYIESSGATGIQITNGKARVTVGADTHVSFEADAFSIIGGAQIVGAGAQFELAPHTPNLGVTLGAGGTGLSLASLTGIGPINIRIGEVTLPGGATKTTAGSIVIGGNFGTNSTTLDLEALGQVTENASGTLSVGLLTGTAASFTLTNPGNALSVINNLTATGGDITVVNGQNLELSGTQSGNNLFYEVAVAGDNLSLGTFEGSTVNPAILTAAAGGRISLVQDNLTQVIGSTVTATNGRVELAPFSAINTSLAGFTGLAIDSSILGIISTGTTGTLVVGGYTHVLANATAPTASAASVTIDGAVDLTGVASTLLLQALALGPITENAGPLTVGTLAATGGVITLNNPNNAINALGDVTSTSFTLNDILALKLTGDVTATTSASITDTVSLTQTGDLKSPAITLSAGSGGIALDAPSVLGQTGATVSLTSSGGVNQAPGATLIAGTLQTLTAGISGGPATFAGTANAIATLGSFNVTGNPLSLSDTGTLTITGPVIATAVTIGGTAGSTPTGITLTGDLTAPTITLSAAGGGIALNGTSVLGQSGATVDLTSTGGVNEAAGATLTAGTLQSTGDVTGGAADFAGTANAIATLGGFAVPGGALSLSDTGALTITGPVTAGAVTIGGTAGTTPTRITLTGDLAAATITLSAGNNGIALNGTSVLGQNGALVDLTSTGGVAEVAGAKLIAGTLQSTGGISGGAVTFAGTTNAIAGLGSFAVTGNALSLSDTGTLAISGPVTATAVTIGGTAGSTPTGITLTGDLTAPTITLSAGGSGIALNGASVLGQSGALVNLNSSGGVDQTAGATLTAATLESTGGVSGGAATFAGTNNAIATLGGFTVIGNALSLSDTGPLSITGPVTASAVTIGGTAGSAPTGITLTGDLTAAAIALSAGANGIALNAGSLLGQTGATVDLSSAGGVNEAAGATLTAGTLQSTDGVTGGAADFAGTANAIATLGGFTVPGNALSLSDTGPLTITGPVTASAVTIGGTAGTTPTGITLTGDLAAPTITLSAGGSGIALNGTAVLGQNGALVNLDSSGGVNEAATAALIAGTLQSPGGITGGAARFAGANNAIATLGGFTVAGNLLSLSDTGTLAITGPVTATAVTIGGTAGSTPTGITLTGDLTAPTITLSAGGSGIALNGTSVLGQSGATVDLSSAGGVNEAAGATLTAGTLRSTNGVTGGAANFAGTANAIATLGGFAVPGGALDLSDTGTLNITGPVTASAVTIGGTAGTTPTGIALTGDLAAATITLSAGNSGIALTGASVLGQTGAVVDLTSTGGVAEVAGAKLIAGTLQSTGGVTGGAATFAGTTNAIAGLGNFAVTGNALSLSDTGLLAITGPVNASVVTIGGAAGSTPTGISLTGDLTAPTITLSAGGSGIALSGASVLGQQGALVDLNSSGGVDQGADSTLIAATLRSTGGVSGGAATFSGVDNAIATLGSFTVTDNALSLSDTGPLSIVGLVTATAVTIGGTAGSTPTSITLAGDLTGPAITLSAGGGGIALNSNSELGQSTATVDLNSTGGITEDTHATLVAGTLESTGGVTGGAAIFAGTNNAIAGLGPFGVGNNALTLSDTGPLTITGPVTAGTVTIGGTAGSTPSTITVNAGIDVTSLLSLSAGSGGIALNGSTTAGTLDLLTTGPVSQSAPVTADTLTGNASSVVLDANTNNIATLGSFTTTNAGFDLNDSGFDETLSVTGPVTAATTVTLTVSNSAGIDVTGSIGAGSILSLVSGNAGLLLTGNAKLTGSTIDLADVSGAIVLNENAMVGQSGASVDLTATGNITQTASATLIAATLQTASDAVVDLAGAANAVGALGNISAGTSFTLNDTTNLALNAQLSSPHIAVLDPGQTVTLADGAGIVTGGTAPPSPRGPPGLKQEPSNGGPGAFIEAASFTQVGSSTLTSQGAAGPGPTLQISVTNHAQFDPPLGLQAPTGWLILNLGNGTAAGNVFVAALNVTYNTPGSTNLTGTIAGIAGGAAATAGFIQPGINLNYLFNGCEIGAAVCLPLQSLPPGEVPPFGPPDLIGPPTLASLLPLQLLALPIATPACTSNAPATGEANAPEHACALTDPDVVPPNVSYVDY